MLWVETGRSIYYFTALLPEEPLLVAGRDCRFHATVEAQGNSSNPDPHARVMFLVNQVKQGMPRGAVEIRQCNS